MPGFLLPLPDYRNLLGDGENLVLLTPLYWRDDDGRLWRICPSATTDGPSIPKWLRPLVAKIAAAFLPGIFHDGLWRGYAEVWTVDNIRPQGYWKRAIPDFEESTLMFRRALVHRGMNPIEAEALYLSVMKAGGEARLGDMAMPTPNLPHSIPDPQQPDVYLLAE